MKIENSSKTMGLVVLLITLLVVSGLLTNAIIYNFKVSTPALGNKKSNQILNFSEFTQFLANGNLADLAILAGVKDLKLLFQTDENSRLLKNKALLVHNKTDDWLTFDTDPIEINYQFRILLRLIEQDDDNYLYLSGKLNSLDMPWWKGIHRLYITYNKLNKKLILRFRDGTAENKLEYIDIDKNKIADGTVILNFLDPQGRYLIVTNTLGQELKQIDLTRLKKAKLPHGLFPYQELYLGYSIAPHSKLQINQLLYAE
jgi:hypothetical protein